MAISSELRISGPYDCDGIVVGFPFHFKVFDEEDVAVVLRLDGGIEQELQYGTDFTVYLPDQKVSPGGTITTTQTYNNAKLLITSKQKFLQEANYQNAGRFYADSLNNVFDKLVILAQQLKNEVDRSAKVPISGIGGVDPSSVVFGVDEQNNPVLRFIADLTAHPVVLSSFMEAFLLQISGAAARGVIDAAKSGNNSDITHLDSPYMGGATAVTQPGDDNSTKVATTEFVNQKISSTVLKQGIPSVSNLEIITNSGSVAVGASALTLRRVGDLQGNDCVTIANISEVADVLVSGAGGLDTGIMEANTWYAVYVITEDVTSLLAGLISKVIISKSADGPLMPVGYDPYYIRVGWVKTSNNPEVFLKSRQQGMKAIWQPLQSTTPSTPLVLKDTFGQQTLTVRGDFIPSTAVSITITSEVANNASIVSPSVDYDVWSGNPPYKEIIGGGTYINIDTFEMPLESDSIVANIVNVSGGSVALYVRGWEDSI